MLAVLVLVDACINLRMVHRCLCLEITFIIIIVMDMGKIMRKFKGQAVRAQARLIMVDTSIIHILDRAVRVLVHMVLVRRHLTCLGMG